MQSECMAIPPQFIWSYAWKVPPARPAIFERAQKALSQSDEKASGDAAQAEHPSIPWKAYLASREFQHLASDLADAIFAEPKGTGLLPVLRPACLRLSAPATGEKPLRGLLAYALPQGETEVSQETEPRKQSRDVAIAA